MTQIYAFNKARNTTYVYESESHWDKDKKLSVSKRKLIGKIDPKTGNIIPTEPRGRKKSRRRENATSTPKKPNYRCHDRRAEKGNCPASAAFVHNPASSRASSHSRKPLNAQQRSGVSPMLRIWT